MKKVLSLVLVIAMVLSSMSFAFASTFTDIADIDYEEAIETLEALGVITGYEDGTYRPEKTVTRAEMAKLMVELLGYGSLVSGSKSNFSDTQGHWADQWIALAAGRGIVIGTGDGKFNPDGIVTYDQVLTMLVRGLGYTDNCNELKNMTWPTNFKVKAAELNITKNVDMSSNNADRGGVAQAMFNSLDQQLVKVNSDGDVVREYKTVGDDDKVPVRLVSRVAAPKTIVVDFKHIDADSKDYAGNKVDLTPYLFQTVEVYFNRNNDKEAVYVGDVESVTYKDTVESAEFDNKSLDKLEVGDYTFDNFAGLGSNVSFNGVQAKIGDFETEDDLKDAKVTVVFDDKTVSRVSDDAKIVGLIVEKANAFVQIEEEYVDGATELDEIYLPVKNKKVDEKNLIVTGDVTELSDIKANDIVSVYAPFGKDATAKATDSLKLVVTRKVIEGKVTGLASEAYYVDKTKYEVNDYLNIDELEVGDEGTFYLDDSGKIIAFTGESEGSKTYAVVDEIYSGRFEVIDGKARIITAPRVKLATSADEKVTYEFDVEMEKVQDKWVVKGKLSGAFEVTQPTATTLNEGKVTYKVDADNKLVSYSLDSKDKTISAIETAGRLIENIKTDSKSFILANNVAIFDKDGNVISESKLGSEVEKGYAVYKNGKIVALYASEIDNEGTAYYAYVTSVYKDTDNDGDTVQRINAYTQGKKNETLLTDKKDTMPREKSAAKGLYVLEFNDEEVVTKVIDDDIAFNKANAVTASAVNSSTGKITIGEDDSAINVYYEQGAATIIKIDADGDVELVSKLSSIKADSTKFIAFNKDFENATTLSNGDTVSFIIIFE
jgi:hypothetical protein